MKVHEISAHRGGCALAHVLRTANHAVQVSLHLQVIRSIPPSPIHQGSTTFHPALRKRRVRGVDVWSLDFASNLPCVALSVSEIAKAGRFRTEAQRSRYVLTHSALRYLLARYLHTSPAELICGDSVKPALKNGGPRFSMSHSGDIAVFAISQSREVGIDVERMGDAGVEQTLLELVSGRKRDELMGLPREARRVALFRAWTRMEAYYKGLGCGLPDDLGVFETFLARTSQHPDSPARQGGGHRQGQRWTVLNFRPRQGYVAALAVSEAALNSEMES